MSNSFIFLDIINTMWYDYRGTGKSEDRLENSEWVRLFIEKWGVSHLLYPTNKNIQSLQQIRQLMRKIIEKTNQNQEPAPDEIRQLNGIMANTKKIPSLIKTEDRYELIFESSEESWESFISEVALSFSKMFAGNQYKRLKICKNKDCLWVFYDKTKNGRKHWCSSDACGNLQRVRKHRETH